MGCIDVKVKRLGQAPTVSCGRVGEPPRVACALVCGIDMARKYLEVAPEVMWLVDDAGIFEVHSNTRWSVE